MIRSHVSPGSGNPVLNTDARIIRVREYHTEKEQMIRATIRDRCLELETDPSLFSPRKPDPGTLALLSVVDLGVGDKVLDLGCGYGVVGIYAAQLVGTENVVLSDNNPRAIELARLNAERNGCCDLRVFLSDGFRDLRETGFTKILCNPPYHTDFSTPKHFIEKGFNRLKVGGEMWFVTKRERWYRNKFISIFGGVHIRRSGSYLVFEAIKKTHGYSRT